jgi:Transport protein Avl9
MGMLGFDDICRDKLGVVTRAFFNQLDFTETDILVDFYNTLETSLRTQLTESGFYMGTSLWVYCLLQAKQT